MGSLDVSVAKALHSFASQLSRSCSSKRNVLFFFLCFFLTEFSLLMEQLLCFGLNLFLRINLLYCDDKAVGVYQSQTSS